MAEFSAKLWENPYGIYVMRWVDPITGKWRDRSTKTRVLRDAERKLGAHIRALAAGEVIDDRRITWDRYCKRYADEHLSTLSASSRKLWAVVCRRLHGHRPVRSLASLDGARLSQFSAYLREEGLSEAGIANYLRTIKASLGWAKKIGLIAVVPAITMPRKSRSKSKKSIMRSRPVRDVELARILDACGVVRPADGEVWRQLIHGLWLSGLRMGEAETLSWDDEADLKVDLSGKHPRLRIYSEGEKGATDRYLPLAPDFCEWLLSIPPERRSGRVFEACKAYGSVHLRLTLAKIGKRSGVVTDLQKEKFATAHDLRRSFGSRWAKRVMPAVLMVLMRHDSIETTMDYYIDLDADDVADLLRRSMGESLGEGGDESATPTEFRFPKPRKHKGLR